ncbi:hypothetical protein LOZ66_001559 [Ophidiomyces ophidiicola]|nr:hypothetical protein LOZ66_001559 [Ophidiomyces ophidiicola]
MSLEIIFTGDNAVKNHLGPEVKSITVHFTEGQPVEIPTGEKRTLRGKSERCIVTYNDETRKRFDATTGYQFKKLVDVTITQYGNDVRAKTVAGIGGEWKLVV